MKKIIGIAVLFSFFGALTAFGAIKAQDLKWYDYIAQMQTPNNGNIFINKFEDSGNTCYIMSSDSSKYGPQLNISCVKVK